jgi:hypothetical protein
VVNEEDNPNVEPMDTANARREINSSEMILFLYILTELMEILNASKPQFMVKKKVV